MTSALILLAVALAMTAVAVRAHRLSHRPARGEWGGAVRGDAEAALGPYRRHAALFLQAPRRPDAVASAPPDWLARLVERKRARATFA